MDEIIPNYPAQDSKLAFKIKFNNIIDANWDLLIWSLLLIWLNYPLLFGRINSNLLYQPSLLNQGQWWRMITYPLVHLSWYHLLLDGGAFLLLYNGLLEQRRWVKLLLVAGCSASSLMFGVGLGTASNQGLSGLSGIAHGLMAFSALEMVYLSRQRMWGWGSLIIVVSKSLYELASGQVFFDFMHMGLCGSPVAACHAGGVLGGILAFVMNCFINRRKTYFALGNTSINY